LFVACLAFRLNSNERRAVAMRCSLTELSPAAEFLIALLVMLGAVVTGLIVGAVARHFARIRITPELLP
jgi:hypothetical protein